MTSDGTLLIADSGDGLVRAIAPGGTITTLAGTRAQAQVGNAAIVSLNEPSGIAIDPQGRLIIAQSGSSTLCRVDNGTLSIIAGTGQTGPFKDGTPALSGQLSFPLALAYVGDTLYFTQRDDSTLDRLAPDGTLHQVVSAASVSSTQFSSSRFLPANACAVHDGIGLTVDPSGRPIWTNSVNHQICRLDADGQVELIAGSQTATSGDSGDGGPAAQALLCAPTAVVCDKAGNLYISDTGNLRIRKIDTQGIITTVAGLNVTQAEKLLFSGQPLTPADGAVAVTSLIPGPGPLCFGPDGTLYVAEMGSAGLAYATGLSTLPTSMIPKIPPRIAKITPDGKLHLVAGADTPLLNNPSDPVNSLMSPQALLIDLQGRLLIEDTDQIKFLPAGSF